MRKLIASALLAIALCAICVSGHAQVRAKVTALGVQLNWVPSALPAGATPVTSYNVYRGTATGAETLLASAGNAVTYTDSTVVAGGNYFYEVTALNSVGESKPSNEVAAVIPAPPPPPVAPNPPVLGTPFVQ